MHCRPDRPCHVRDKIWAFSHSFPRSLNPFAAFAACTEHRDRLTRNDGKGNQSHEKVHLEREAQEDDPGQEETPRDQEAVRVERALKRLRTDKYIGSTVYNVMCTIGFPV